MVHFTPSARTAWHTHPNGQTIYVIEGGSAAFGAAEAPSRPSNPATVCSSSPVRITGTALRRDGSWLTSQWSKSTSMETARPGAPT
jgi:hypothetical protein